MQWLLTHSFAGKALAVRRVTENHGKKTPGVDKVTWSTPDAKYRAVKKLSRHGYAPRPLRRIYIPKSNGKMRALGIPCMVDRAMQALHLLALEPVSETCADSHSYGFRRDRSTADAIEQCFTALAKKTSSQWILEGDIRACFDEISHSWLVTNVPTDTVILQKWLKAGYIEDRQNPWKGARWIRARYFHREVARHWVFAADTGELTAEGKPRRLKLRKASDVPIRRHTQVHGNANPFDPAWESYFEDRYGLKMANALSGRGKLIRLWLDQDRACIVCQQRITAATGWHVHHIVRRVDGGSDAWSNLVMVHPDCHRQIHSRGLTVMKPAPKRGL
ncbi:Retron-type RNA-directed DNA polymerase [Caballeronia sordidicola]|uniref:Retron-type RNA-directed DNA polymerase n=1 Tax=Caballeronia sordidicola TaxID=196367 RepID=A0A226XAM4_CABSO|nr:Retron-type RNA-directed DNA polymerase [Caballeronia sordidicola]